MDPQMLKAWTMVESGGEGDKAAFLSDPFQVNNPGDWVHSKTNYGLSNSEVMTPESSADAALQWLAVKADRPAKSGYGPYSAQYPYLYNAFDNYNANTRIDTNGKPYYVNYADKIFDIYDGGL